jgi:glycosyltransferase involved in cell wall biosynthesis
VHTVALGPRGSAQGSYDIVSALGALETTVRRRLRAALAGDGEADGVRAAVAAAGLGETIRVAGWLDPAARDELLCAAHVFLLPSRDDGLPMAFLEAIDEGLAPVTTTVGSIGEAIRDGITVIVVQPGSPAQIAGALTAFVADDGGRAVDRPGAHGSTRPRYIIVVGTLMPDAESCAP